MMMDDCAQILPPDTDANEKSYGELLVRLGMLHTTHFNVEHAIIRVKFWGQQKDTYLTSENGRFGGGPLSQQQYLIKCPMLLFLKYLEEGVNLVIDVVDKRNSKLIGTALLRWELYLTQLHKNFKKEFVLNEPLNIIKAQQLSTKHSLPEQIGILGVHVMLNFTQKKVSPQRPLMKPDIPRTQPKSQQQQHVIDDQDDFSDEYTPPIMQPVIEAPPNYQEARRVRRNSQHQNQIQRDAYDYGLPPPDVDDNRNYINHSEQIELEMLRLQDDAARLFDQPIRPPPKPSTDLDVVDQIFANENDPNTYNLRSIDSLTVSVQKLQFLPTLGDKIKEKIKNRMFSVECKVPIIRQNKIEYQTFLLQDISRTAMSVYFESQIKSHLEVSTLSQISQCQLQFKVMVQDLNFEFGVGEFQLSTMVMDGLKNFTYEIDITQQKQDAKKKTLVTVATLVVSIQLGSDQRVVESKREKHMETQLLQLKQDLEQQISRQRQEQEQVKEINYRELELQLQTMQLFLQVEQLEYVDPTISPCNFAMKCKQYGMRGETLSSEVMWNNPNPHFDLRVMCAINMSIVDKMQQTQWVLELWNHCERQELLGICKLSLSQIYGQVYEQTSPESYVRFVKTNLFPQIVYDNDLPVESLRTKQTLGIVRVKVAFGTYPQIMRYQKQIQQKEKIIIPPQVEYQVEPQVDQIDQMNQSVSSYPTDLPDLESVSSMSRQQFQQDAQSSIYTQDDQQDIISPHQVEDHKQQSPQHQHQPDVEYGRRSRYQVEDHLKSYRHIINIKLVSIINYQLPPQTQNYQVQVNLFGTNLVADSQIIHISGRITEIPFHTQFVLYSTQHSHEDSALHLFSQLLQDTSIIIFLFDSDNQKLVCKGNLPSEELLQLQGEDVTYVSLYGRDELARVQIQISYQNEIIQRQAQSEVIVEPTVIPRPHIESPLTISAITRKLQPEYTHTIRLNFKQLFWMMNIQKTDQFHIEVSIDQQQLDFALPRLKTEPYQTKIFQDMQHLNISLDYVIKCDQIMINQISRSNFIINLEYSYRDKEVASYSGKIPLVGIFDESGLDGDIPFFNNNQQLSFTISIEAQLSREQLLQDEEPLESVVENMSNYKNLYYVHITELLIMMYDSHHELDELYFMLVDPVTQSESYRVDFMGSQVINTSDCVLMLHNQPQSSVLQLRSLSLGEDKLIGQLELQTQQIIAQLKSESNYLVLHSHNKQLTCRVGVKLYSLNCDVGLDPQFFEPQHLNALKELVEQSQDIHASIKQYMRQTLKMSYSEISFFFNLIQETELKDIFSDDLYIHSQRFNEMLRAHPNKDLISEIAQEFVFHDQDSSGFIDPKHLNTIMGFFDLKLLPSDINQFIPSKQTHQLRDEVVHKIKKSNMFDYVKFLNYLQQTTEGVLNGFFKLNQMGPLKHQIQNTIKKYTPIKESPILQDQVNQLDDGVSKQLDFIEEVPKAVEEVPKVVEEIPEQPQKKENIEPKPPQIYQSSESSSNAALLKEKTSSSGTQLQRIEQKLPPTYKDPEYLKRIEEIMKRNHLNFGVFDQLSSDSDDDY